MKKGEENVVANTKKKPEVTKETKIKREAARLKRIFKELDEDSKKIVESLISKAAFMSVSLDELQEIVNEKGYVEEYQNGQHQHGIKKRSELELYNTMIKNYTTVIKEMYSMLPTSKVNDAKKAGEELAKFIHAGKPQGRGKT